MVEYKGLMSGCQIILDLCQQCALCLTLIVAVTQPWFKSSCSRALVQKCHMEIRDNRSSGRYISAVILTCSCCSGQLAGARCQGPHPLPPSSESSGTPHQILLGSSTVTHSSPLIKLITDYSLRLSHLLFLIGFRRSFD